MGWVKLLRNALRAEGSRKVSTDQKLVMAPSMVMAVVMSVVDLNSGLFFQGRGLYGIGTGCIRAVESCRFHLTFVLRTSLPRCHGTLSK